MKLVCGLKGSGKTEKMVRLANEQSQKCKGVEVYLDKSNHRMHVLDRNIRLVDMSEYHGVNVDSFVAFVQGMLAVNFDIEHIFADELISYLKIPVENAPSFLEKLKKIEEKYNVEFCIAITVTNENEGVFSNYKKI